MVLDGKKDVHLDGSPIGTVSRLEVIEGPTGRRVRSEAERARMNDNGGVELYPNQGDGVVTSLCWGDGLVFNKPGLAINKGDSVRFVPFSELLS